ncbi:hypothetical protein ACFC1L_40140 [Streptomyces sp. NPDC056210]|uniref:hypothetical protein n=1 Tax=Streptomyces sp. NPDC056210 TaxID=3345746 RepID=UPI0035E25941
MNWIKNNTTAIYSVLVSLIPLIATFGVQFDQEKVLGVISAVLALVAGFGVRQASLKATEDAKEEVPDGFVHQSEFFPPVDYSLPENDMSAVDQAENVEG